MRAPFKWKNPKKSMAQLLKWTTRIGIRSRCEMPQIGRPNQDCHRIRRRSSNGRSESQHYWAHCCHRRYFDVCGRGDREQKAEVEGVKHVDLGSSDRALLAILAQR